jgi:hypothetical protein
VTKTPKRRTGRLTPEQRADIKARVATWPPLTQRAQVTVLFGPYLDALGKRPDRRS